MEKRTARLTVLIDPKKKATFEKLCALDDVNASQKVRQMIREYIEEKLGESWQDDVFK
ncbi:CopG family transcriptional regulator [Colwellia hornerae]|uniref:CopG family transcriptional regulator n=1 Tax=Colwellia hornerae TaxID=89402 RepID=A0A5C6QK82_9GAMM|nr:CopG family transcriptional regulator [Colwellia hornerae]TWX53385.1 CopG family transcriptional regulator [Colwellia hornerae]TWX60205.1 CopG family transcriptional regulator [Colwellia hornerae]TWX69002.1 CopG family transcriptional regulator [Colwellia hornerae]